MASETRLSREESAAEFWADVRVALGKRYERYGDEADLGIGRYRRAVELLGLGDVVYNQGVERAAEVIDSVIEHGLPTDIPDRPNR
jgi:hypothetical protein